MCYDLVSCQHHQSLSFGSLLDDKINNYFKVEIYRQINCTDVLFSHNYNVLQNAKMIARGFLKGCAYVLELGIQTR